MLTHINKQNQAAMVDISAKETTKRTATAESRLSVSEALKPLIAGDELISKKGPVFQTAIIAGVMAAKKTPELIPLCHGLNLEDCQIKITLEEEEIVIVSTAVCSGKTGVEMEAMTACTVAALTVYDMCKAVDKAIAIKSTRLLHKTGGKSDFSAPAQSPTDKKRAGC